MIAVVGSVINSIQVKVTPPEREGEDPNAAMSFSGRDNIRVQNVGCGYNVAGLLAGKGCEVSFVSAAGKDALGFAAANELEKCGVKTHIKMVDGVTPVSVEMQNILGDVEMLRSNYQVLEAITAEHVMGSGALDNAEIIFVDGSIPEKTVIAVAEAYGDKAKIFYDPAGTPNGSKIASVLHEIYCVMPGRREAEDMTGLTILGQDQLMAAGTHLADAGVKKIVLTMKGGGIYYKEGFNEGIQRPDRVLSFAQTKGAGDIVSAAIVAAEASGVCIEDAVAAAMSDAAEFLADLSDERPY